MRICFLHNPYYHQKYMENVPFTSNNFGTFPPLGMMYASSILKEEGHETCIIDVKAEELSEEEVRTRIRSFDPDVVGVMVIPYTAGISMEWAEKVDKWFDVTVVAGNYGVQMYPEAVVSREFIDFGVRGPATNCLDNLLKHLSGDDIPLEEIPGLVYCENGKVKMNDRETLVEDFSELPWPDRENVEISNYGSMLSKKKPFTILVTSYGCVYGCDFCDMGDFGYSERSPEDVVDEIEYCVEEYGVKEIDIFDRDLLIRRDRAERIFEEIVERGVDVEWSCRARVDEVDDELLKLMRKAGCRLILFGVESGDQEILDSEHKGITLWEIKEGIRKTKEHGIGTVGFFIIGHPGETRETFRKTVEFAKELPLDYAQFFRMSGKPGARLYEEVEEEMGFDYFEKLIKGEVKERDVPRPWTDFSNKELNSMVKKAYLEFYLRPGFIFSELLTIRTLEDLKSHIKVGFEMVRSKVSEVV